MTTIVVFIKNLSNIKDTCTKAKRKDISISLTQHTLPCSPKFENSSKHIFLFNFDEYEYI